MSNDEKKPGARKEISRIALVSGSPRRRTLLEQLGLSYSVSVPDVDETIAGRLSPLAYARTIARRKMIIYMERNRPIGEDAAIADAERDAPVDERTANTLPVDDWALAADTVVALGNRIIGKPADAAEAEAILRSLSGRSHRVITALALFNPYTKRTTIGTATTRVFFERLTDEEVEWYLRSEEWRDVAGGYRIQERGSVLVRKIVGSYSNVVGLPLETFYGMVRAQGFYLFPAGE